MTALAEPAAPAWGPADLHVQLEPKSLRLWVGRRDGLAGYVLALEPETAVKLAYDLLQSAALLEIKAAGARAELNAIASEGRDRG